MVITSGITILKILFFISLSPMMILITEGCVHCEQEIQTLNGEIERLENASKEEIAELKSKISSLKKQLYQAKKDIRDNEKHISSIESQLVNSKEQVEKL